MSISKKPILLLVVVVVFLAGCTYNSSESGKKPQIKNQEWVEAIGLFDHENAPVDGLGESDDEISISILCDNGYDGYDALAEIINKHNGFVDANPTYFSGNPRILFYASLESEYNTMVFFNERCTFHKFSQYEDALERSSTDKIQYAYIGVSDVPQELYDMQNKFDIPVVIFQMLNASRLPEDSFYEALNAFSNLETVILEYSGKDLEYDPAEISGTIQKYAPGVKVFDVRSMTYVN